MKFRVKPGKSFGPGGRFPAGTVLELTEAEAKGFEDKLERVVEGTQIGLINEVLDQPIGLRNELGAEVPEELKILPPEEPVSTETEEPGEHEKPTAKPKPRTQRKKAGEG